MTNSQWVQSIINGEQTAPRAQYWMSFFNADTARSIAPREYHFEGMSLYEVGSEFDMTGMSHKDLDKLIAFNEYTDRIFACLGKGAAIMFGHGGPGEFFCKSIEKGDNHVIVQYETGVKSKVQFDPHFYHTFDHPVKTMDHLQKLILPDPHDPKRYAGLADNAGYLKSKGQYVVGSLNGFFSGIHYFLMDYQDTLISLITEPELIQAAVDKIGQWNLAAAENMIKAGVDGLAICDDLGSKQNLLMPPQLYRKFFKPWHKKLCDLAHSRSATVHLHSHGAIHELLDDLVDCGFDFINPFDPEEGYDIENILKNYSDKFVVVGGFPGSFWYWPLQQQDEYLNQMAALGKKYPRFIFMDSSGIPNDITAEKYLKITEMSKIARNVK
ncbi:methylcobalamin:coenzyme M methyltransferase [Limihaloglobus sulfuriphilus]|uniref:Methylcobalamin:coenzyme M methyltransferase n=1 Tax=Limihaloglobus sulfuriphilus TaxID=1851148 RepID=A0A1Q2MEG6_9BACT|nr:uroporphyrinogen decarboxylase family protein [Limihaloglobus sulfuriphilus]AQQ70938.1 methylcobalamin:coenzyme M methyltransferase [Limihaloglobus sulfuriphilus]